MKRITIALFTLATVAISSSAHSEAIKFNGDQYEQVASAQNAVITFHSKKTSNETVSIRTVNATGKFDEVSRAFIDQARSESGDAKLLVMDKPKTQELMVAYFKMLEHNKVLYKIELMSASKGSVPVSVAYSFEFDRGKGREVKDTMVKRTAIVALARFDMNKARKMLGPL